jgi:hypothetical protein
MNGNFTSEQKVSSHRTAKLLIFLFIFVAGVFYGQVLFYKQFLTFFLPENVVIKVFDREMNVKEAYKELPKIKMDIDLHWRQKGLSLEEKQRIVKHLEKKIQKIEKRYPLPTLFNILNRNNYPYARPKAVAYFLFTVLLSISPIIFLFFYDKKKLRDFFLQEGRREKPISLGRPFGFIDWKFLGTDEGFVAKEIFDGEERYLEILAVFDKQIIADVRIFSDKERKKIKINPSDVVIDFAELNRDIKKILDSLAKYGYSLGFLTPEQEKKFRAVVGFALFHYVSSFFGNVPSGFIVKRLKDFTIKRFMSMYYYGKIVNVVFDNVVKEREKEPADFLRIFHGYAKEKEDFLTELRKKYCQIPDMDFFTTPNKKED